MARKAAEIHLNQEEQKILKDIARSRTALGIDLTERARIVLAAAIGLSNVQIVRQEKFEEHRVATWRNRWKQQHDQWKQSDEKLRPPMSKQLVVGWLRDRKGRGKKPSITPEQKALILAVACEPPSQSGYPHTHWTDRLLAQEVIKRGIVDYIAFQTVWRFLKDQRPETAQKPLLAEHGD